MITSTPTPLHRPSRRRSFDLCPVIHRRGIALFILMLVVSSSWSARAYRRDAVDGRPTYYLYWNTRTITWYMDIKGCDSIGIERSVGAAKKSFFAWASPWCTDIYFNFGGMVSNATSNIVLAVSAKPDKKNVITWHKTWPPKGADSVSPDTIAQTTLKYDADTGVIEDADIDLDGTIFWTANETGSTTQYDVQAVLTQEIGHLLGLRASENPDSIMHGGITQGYLTKRVLDKDDIAAVCDIYPFDGDTPMGKGQPNKPPEISGSSGCAVSPAIEDSMNVSLLLGLFLFLFLTKRHRRKT